MTSARLPCRPATLLSALVKLAIGRGGEKRGGPGGAGMDEEGDGGQGRRTEGRERGTEGRGRAESGSLEDVGEE